MLADFYIHNVQNLFRKKPKKSQREKHFLKFRTMTTWASWRRFESIWIPWSDCGSLWNPSWRRLTTGTKQRWVQLLITFMREFSYMINAYYSGYGYWPWGSRAYFGGIVPNSNQVSEGVWQAWRQETSSEANRWESTGIIQVSMENLCMLLHEMCLLSLLIDLDLIDVDRGKGVHHRERATHAAHL